MQNRSMFPYRRHGGAKKRAKNGPMRNKGRGPQRPLPNSARELLPLLQPATKALAQVLAGHSQASGQVNHARNLLAHAERLVAERSHNRLNPREREEFFEQLARLKLTLADAEVEAEVQAVEDQGPPQPVAPPVGRERLLEMALALGTSDREPPYGSARAVAAATESGAGADGTRGHPPRRSAGRGAADDREDAADRHGRGNGAARSTHATAGVADAGTKEAPDAGPRLARSGKRSERLVLMAKRAPAEVDGDARPAEADGDASPAKADSGEKSSPGEAQSPSASPAERQDEASSADEPVAGAASKSDPATLTPRPRRQRKSAKGLPEGWVVDDEGFVVPGPS